jgi:type IV pilus assembly protein PilW
MIDRRHCSLYTLSQGNQRGLTLVEIMVAITIGLFLLGGLFTVVQNTRQVFGKQNQLTLLQENERIALTVIADVVQQAGYFPDPTVNTAGIVATPITGTYNATAPGDTFAVAYRTRSGDGVVNCSGQQNTTGADVTYTNAFSVNGTGQLICTIGGTNFVLANGIQTMSVLYGVVTNVSANCLNCVDNYLNATQVAGNWPNVVSVMVTLTFANPLYSAAAGADKQPQTISVSRIVNVMSRLGIST